MPRLLRASLKGVLIAAVALAALIAGYYMSLWWRHGQLVDNDMALVDFSLPDIEGKERWLSEWQGKTIVLNFWATWCTPCKEEMPILMAAHKRYQDRGLRVIGVAIDTREAVAAYARELGIDYPLLIGDEAGLGIMSRYGNPRGALPYTVVIGSDGTVAAKKLGAFRGDELDKTIEALVSADPKTTIPK